MNPIWKLVKLSQVIWDNKKDYDFQLNKSGRNRSINRIEKDINELELLLPKLRQEIVMLRDMNK